MIDYQQLPAETQEAISKTVWESWSEEQKEYVLAQIQQPFTGTEVGASSLHYASAYIGKTWFLAKADHEHCQKCSFDYLLCAVPRNWTVSDADVWNLTKCADVNCQNLDEWCW